MELKKVNENLTLGCEVYSNSQRWGHLVRLFFFSREIESNKVRYYNRTWERYQFESALSGLVSKLDRNKKLPLKDRLELSRFIQNYR